MFLLFQVEKYQVPAVRFRAVALRAFSSFTCRCNCASLNNRSGEITGWTVLAKPIKNPCVFLEGLEASQPKKNGHKIQIASVIFLGGKGFSADLQLK